MSRYSAIDGIELSVLCQGLSEASTGETIFQWGTSRRNILVSMGISTVVARDESSINPLNSLQLQ